MMEMNVNLNDGIEQVIKTILYFEIFGFPLKKEEIFKFSNVDKNTFEIVLNDLLEKNVLKNNADYYSVYLNGSHSKSRIDSKKLIEKKLRLAKKIGKFIYQFPYVHSVFISGS